MALARHRRQEHAPSLLFPESVGGIGEARFRPESGAQIRSASKRREERFNSQPLRNIRLIDGTGRPGRLVAERLLANHECLLTQCTALLFKQDKGGNLESPKTLFSLLS